MRTLLGGFQRSLRLSGCLAVIVGREAFDSGSGPSEAGRDLVCLDLGDRTSLPLRGLPGALPEPSQDHDPVALVQRLGEVDGSLPPGVDPEERRPPIQWVSLAGSRR
jgi:hypothetical protein